MGRDAHPTWVTVTPQIVLQKKQLNKLVGGFNPSESFPS